MVEHQLSLSRLNCLRAIRLIDVARRLTIHLQQTHPLQRARRSVAREGRVGVAAESLPQSRQSCRNAVTGNRTGPPRFPSFRGYLVSSAVAGINAQAAHANLGHFEESRAER